jgi:hypothetical protein
MRGLDIRRRGSYNMNMFIFQTRPAWGFLVGAAAVGIPTALLVLATDGRAHGLAWLAALTATLVGAGWASLLTLHKRSTDLQRATRLGSYAWMATTFVFGLPLSLYFLPFLLFTLPIAAIFGACMGAAVGGVLRWIDVRVAPEPRVVLRRKGRR